VGDRLSGQQRHFEDEGSKAFRNVGHTAQGRTTGTGGCRAAASPPPPQTPQNRDLKNTDFIDIISKDLRDLPFRRNQLPKSADDQYIRILKNKLIKLKKKPEDRTL
jgi:hypothetical protein